MVFLAFLVAWLLAGVGSSASTTVLRVTPAGEASCVLNSAGTPRSEGRFIPRPGADEWEWSPSPADVVHCDAAGFEPVDMHGDTLDAARIAISMTRGREIHIDVQEEGPVEIEWRTEDGGTPNSRLLATRRLAAGGSISVWTAPAKRILRVYRPDAAPVSVLPPEGKEPWDLRLPAAVRGGEVVGRVLPRSFWPSMLLLETAHGTQDVSVGADGVFQIVGVSPGPARLVPVYRGGMGGEALEMEVVAGQTTEHWAWRLPEAGAAEIVPVETLCMDWAPPLWLAVSKAAQGRTTEWSVEARSEFDSRTCITELEGLPPGHYRVDLTSWEMDEVFASAEFEASADTTTHVRLGVPEVRVFGRVTFQGDRPAADASLRFIDSAATSWDTRTDATGQFEILLGGPGEYTIAVGGSPYLHGAEFERTYVEGEQESNLVLPSGALRIRIVRADGGDVNTPLQFEARGPVTRVGVVLPDEAYDFTLFGLELGRYSLVADAPPDLVCAEPVEVELTEESPEASAEVVLTRATARLFVFDPNGRPARGIWVRAGGRTLDEEGPGVFSLARISAGTAMGITPGAGLLPTCRMMSGNVSRDLVVVLEPRGTAALTVVTQTPANDLLGTLVGLPGAECPVPCKFLGATYRPAGAGSVITVPGLPPGRYIYTRAGATTRAEVPGPPVSSPPGTVPPE